MLYAAYGSSLHPLSLLEHIDSTRFVGTAELIGWTLRFNGLGEDGSGRCSLEPSAACTHLAVYSLAERGLAALQALQSPGFEPSLLHVEPFGTCLTFVAKQRDSGVLPYEWYRAQVELGARYHRFPKRYVQRISAQDTRVDPDPLRREHARATIERMRAFPTP